MDGGSSSRKNRGTGYAAGEEGHRREAKRLGLPISELMRRGANAYRPEDTDEELGALAAAAKAASNRAAASIDSAIEFIDASNKRIAALEAKSKRGRRRSA